LKTKTLNKVVHPLTLFAALLILASPLQAQHLVRPQAGFVRLRNGLVKAQRNIADATLKRDSLGSAHFNRHYYVLVQFDLLPDSVQKVQMINSGLRLFDYLADRTYLAEVDDSFSIDELKKYAVSGLFRLPGSGKIASRLQQHAQEDLLDPDQLIAINYFGTLTADQVRQGITAAGASIQTVKFQPPHIYFARVADTLTLRRLAALPYVSYIASQPIKPRVLNYNNRAAQGADALGATSGRRLFGDGVVVGVGDDANPSSHIDFTGRLIIRTPAPYNVHGTHTSGTVGGGGILNPMYQGMAPHSTIVSQYFSDILANAPTYISDYDMVLTNNSYTDYPDGCAYDGEYDALAYATDEQLYQYPYLLHMFASGNDGGYTCTPYPFQFATIKSGFQCAKNALIVGQVDNTNSTGTNTYISGAGSSAGPTLDGRLKPEIVAGGSGVISTTPGNGYEKDWGTSMASPTITGAMALLVQRYRQLSGGGDPPAILLKALACNTANDLGNPGPDYIFGYGAMNARAAVQCMEGEQFGYAAINNGQTQNFSLPVPPGLAQLRIMIYWNDYPAAPFSPVALVNNLDLTVKDPTSFVHHPLILNSNPASVNNNAVEGIDSVNNIEQVVVNNPTGGTYQIGIKGTSVPAGPQECVIVYQFLQPSIIVEYPYGNDTWVPGNREIIRWNAYDGSSNTFTIAYSADNGSTWTTINNAVAANAGMYDWTTPATATNQALIRVSRNGTSYSGTSTYRFTVLGQPVVTGTSPCQGYAQLLWNTIPSATSYDIMQLVGDTMVKVANTTDTSYLLGHLNRDSSYWLGVRAVNGATAGRRSVSVNVFPVGGACTLDTLNNDYTVDSAIGLVSGRLYTSTQLSSSTPIRVEVRNLGTIASASPFTLSYSINGGTPVTETSNAVVAANSGTYTYTFSTPADFSAQGTYSIQVWVSYPADPNLGNDTLTTVIKQLSNAAINLSSPYTEGLESAASATYYSPTMGFTGLDRCDFSANAADGRVRTFVNTGMCRTGNRCAILDQYPYATVTTADSLIMTFNLSSYTASDQIWLDFYYRNQGNDSVQQANKVWIRGNDQAAWVPVYILDTNQANVGIYQPSSHIDITGSLANAVPSQSISSSFQIKFGEQGYTSANDVVPDPTVDDGYIFDDITLSRSTNDIGIIRLVSPAAGNQCALSSATSISIQVKNYSSATATNIPITYAINGDTVSETIPLLNAGDSTVYTFSTTIDMSAFQSYSISGWVHYPGDTYSANDTLATQTIQTSPLINTFPYLEGFESGNGNWFTGGLNSSWQWGAPQKTIINKAANGNNCWVTSLTGDYNSNELSYLYSPCFDLSSLTSPELSFSHIFQTEDDCACDYHWAEYSLDDTTWIRLGAAGNGTNWYDDATNQTWQMSYTKWHVSSYDIPVTASRVRFRIVMSSDPATTYEGVGIDDVHVFDKASIYKGANDSLAQPVSGTNWINFALGGNLIASINPNGQDLGVTNVKVFFNHTGAVRNNNAEYYLDRNIVIQPTNQPAGNVGIRYYFLDSEAVNLINATGCTGCTTIADAYQSGVTQFSSPNSAEEDSTLNNDTSGVFVFHMPHTDVSIIPNDNGYYAEYQVSGFSEFWVNNGGPVGSLPTPATTLSFTAVRAGDNALLQWSTTDAITLSRFIIEKSTDSIHFTVLDSVAATADGNTVDTYQYTDTHLDSGYNYYRLREVMQNGSLAWSPVRVVQGPDGGGSIGVYPNPAPRHGALYVTTTSNTEHIRLIDVSGRIIVDQEVRGSINIVPLGNLAPGIYFVDVVTDSGSSIKKVLIK
jgi:Subtilase family/Secretion system C-terminal sorting domain